jgi:hypothetical protein
MIRGRRQQAGNVDRGYDTIGKTAATLMLELTARRDLMQLDDTGLADRLDRAWQANESVKKKFGWRYWLYLYNWMPRVLVEDPFDYWYPSQILSEIRDITAEIERRVQVRKNAGI